jgi:hypothetical protein
MENNEKNVLNDVIIENLINSFENHGEEWEVVQNSDFYHKKSKVLVRYENAYINIFYILNEKTKIFLAKRYAEESKEMHSAVFKFWMRKYKDVNPIEEIVAKQSFQDYWGKKL